jgi:hypothetical protein
MPGEDGFKLLDKLPYKPNVIVTTSNIDHAYTGFEYRVNDFLKKPFTYQRFLQAAQKLNMDQPQKIAVTEPDHVFIKSEGKILKLNNEEIQYIESMGDYVKFITRGKKYITHHTVKALEEKLNKNVFLKIHRSFIVNLNSIEDLKENSVLVNGTEIPVSKKHRQEVLKRLPLL